MMTERQVATLVGKVAGDRLPPRIEFVDGPLSHTHDNGITLMSPEFWKKHKVGTAAQYRLLVLHEMNHWFMPGEGHTARFYYQLYFLCRDFGVRLSVAYEDEVKYKPRAARAGLELLVA
jgi:elongation factor P hydroxylase